MSDVVVRQAHQEDLPAAAELLDEMSEHQAPWRVFRPRSAVREHLLARFGFAREDPAVVHLVAEVEGAVVGMAFAAVHRPSTVSDEDSVELSSFVVRASHRRRGIGSALLAAVEAFARVHGIQRMDLRVFADNQEAVAFWAGAGFRPRMIQMVADVPDAGRESREEIVDGGPGGARESSFGEQSSYE